MSGPKYKLLNFKAETNVVNPVTGHSLLNKEGYGAASHEAAMLVISAAIGSKKYSQMSHSELSKPLLKDALKDIEDRLVQYHPELLSVQTQQLSEGKLPTGNETVAFITEVRDAILDIELLIGEHDKNFQLSELKTATAAERTNALAKRAKHAAQLQHLEDEAIIKKYLGDDALPVLEGVEPEVYDQMLSKAASYLRVGKADKASFTVLGLSDEQYLKAANAVSDTIEATRTHTAQVTASKPSSKREIF